MQYRKLILFLIAAAFFIFLLYIADQIPAPRRKKHSEPEESTDIEQQDVKTKKGRGIGKQALIGIAAALVLLAALGAGIRYMVLQNGGKSAKESVAPDERTEAAENESTVPGNLWSVSSGTTLVLPEEQEVQDSAEETGTEEQEEGPVLAVGERVMPVRPAIAGDILFVGDSRFVGMSRAVPYDDLYIAQVSVGYEWFRDTAVPEIDRAAVPGTKLVINMGINDLENSARYAALINDSIGRWTDAGIEVFYLSVNPVIDGRTYATNAMIASFNSFMSQTLDPRIHWIDSYAVLMEEGIRSADGVHYLDETSLRIYEYCTSEIMRYQPPAPVLPEDALLPPPEGELPDPALILPDIPGMPEIPAAELQPETGDVMPPAETPAVPSEILPEPVQETVPVG